MQFSTKDRGKFLPANWQTVLSTSSTTFLVCCRVSVVGRPPHFWVGSFALVFLEHSSSETSSDLRFSLRSVFINCCVLPTLCWELSKETFSDVLMTPRWQKCHPSCLSLKKIVWIWGLHHRPNNERSAWKIVGDLLWRLESNEHFDQQGLQARCQNWCFGAC